MVEIKAGSELDRAVAEAIGIQVAVLHRGQVLVSSREWDTMRGFAALIFQDDATHDVACIPFRPSTDMNDALVAAEKVFDCGFAVHTAGKPVGGWKRFRCIVGVGWHGACAESQLEVEAPTAARAICAAILKLKEREHDGT